MLCVCRQICAIYIFHGPHVSPADYILVKQEALTMAVDALSLAGHVIRFDPNDSICGPLPEKLRPILAADGTMGCQHESAAKYTGLWSRVLLEDFRVSGTLVDSTTLVWWLQAGDFYIDIRIPKTLEGARVFADQSGFAGVLEFVGPHGDSEAHADSEADADSDVVGADADLEVVQWHRLADFAPATTRPDVGLNIWGQDGNSLEEFGHPTPDYKETWVREDGMPDAFAVLLEEPLVPDTRFGCWLFCGKHWARVLGRTCSLREYLGGCGDVTEFCQSLTQLQTYHASVHQLGSSSSSNSDSEVDRRAARESIADWAHSYSCECGVLEERSGGEDPLLRVVHALEHRREGQEWDLGSVLQRDQEVPAGGPIRLIEGQSGCETDSPLVAPRRWRLVQSRGTGPWSRVFGE